MKNVLVVLIIVGLFALVGCGEKDTFPADLKQQFPESVTFSLKNSTDFARKDVSAYLKLDDIKKKKWGYIGV